VIAGIALLIVILTPGGSAYTINAEFTDAGQIVAGDLGELAFRRDGADVLGSEGDLQQQLVQLRAL
jgi:hypothetical protein